MSHAAVHHSVKVFTRSKGHSAVASAAYRIGEKLTDDRTGIEHDYRAKKTGVEFSANIGWDDGDTVGLWNKAEAAEKRKNSTLAREATLAIPAELTPEERARVSRGYALWLRDQYGVAATVAVHKPGRDGNKKNYHAHIQFTTRQVDSEGNFGAKTRILDERKTGSVEIEKMRQEWAKRCNSYLKKKDVNEKIDPRSHKRRAEEDGGPVLPSIPHLGKNAIAVARRNSRMRARGEKAELPRLAMDVLRITTEQNELRTSWKATQRAERQLAAIEAQEPHEMPAPAPQPATPSQTPTYDAEKRQAAMQEALSRLRGPTTPLDFEDDPDTPKKGRTTQQGRGHSR
jgi:hypothetical protein|tara:strand:+ start:719 stop:1747 length:1029 start_codon:yes stop_codon:yes gene_type:complete